MKFTNDMPDSGTNFSGASFSQGAALIKERLKLAPAKPGVYRMLNSRGEVLYVGKARLLPRRLLNYTQIKRLPLRLQRMVAETTDLLIVTTNSEVEALLLEANLIKKLLPRYNILLRDDKSLPLIELTLAHDFPRLEKHYGQRRAGALYYGPFASRGAVSSTVQDLQRVFMLRNCSDSIFSQRTRPCLQYHIKRCTAPCVQKVTADEYAKQVQQARAFLDGRHSHIQTDLAETMYQQSQAQDYESAARTRDRLSALTAIQARQSVNIAGINDADVVAIAQQGGQSCIQIFFFRGGRNFGNKALFPSHQAEASTADILGAFIAQFYADKDIPHEILLNTQPAEIELLRQALTSKQGRRVALLIPQRGARKQAVDIAQQNAEQALAMRLADRSSTKNALMALAERFNLPKPPLRIEVYDNSHIQGRHAVGAMVVATSEGWQKASYRKFNMDTAEITNKTGGDDYAMLREMLTRRLRALTDNTDSQRPDLLLIDGGQGQLNIAIEVLASLNITDIALIAIAKGPDRHAGRETFFLPGQAPISLPPQDPLLYYLQRLRDEAHRFAISSHRLRREKKLKTSMLDSLPGVGAARKKALLQHFGSARAVAAAGVADLAKAPGISTALAQKIHDLLNSSR